MELLTARLILREFADEDVRTLAAYQADGRYAEHRYDEAPPPDAAALVRTFQEWSRERPRRNFQLAIALRETPDELIGTCGVRGGGLPAHAAEFGIELDPRRWGVGYAAEAAGAMLAFGFRRRALHEIRALSVTENTRVRAMASRLGFTAVRTLPGTAWRGRGHRQTEWRLTAEQWVARAGA